MSSLAEFNDLVAVSDLQVPSAVTLVSEPESVIARIEAPRMIEEEEVEVEEEAEVLAEPELVGKEEGEETESGAAE